MATTSSRDGSRRDGRRTTLAAGAAAALAILAAAPPSFADPPPRETPFTTLTTPVVLAPTQGEDELGPAARDVDAALQDAARDLGLTVTSSPSEGSVVRASVRAIDARFIELTMTLTAPGGGSDRVASKRVARGDAAFQAVVLFRQLVAPAPAPQLSAPSRVQPAERLAGRITLMSSSAALGGAVGFSIQAASGSYDARLLVPLTLVGAGIGLGASYLASGEWEVGTGDAWFFTAGAVWGSASGHLVFQGQFSDRADRDRWVFGLVGGGLGATIATLGLALHPMTDAGAVLANAGGAGGLGVGALVESAARKGASQVPYSGMGYGAAIGWLAASTIAVNLRPRWPVKKLEALPTVGVLGESRIEGRSGERRAPVIGVSYALPFHL